MRDRNPTARPSRGRRRHLSSTADEPNVTDAAPIDREPILAYLADKIGGDRELLPPGDESLVDAGIVDSFGLADLVAALEAAYGVKVPDQDISMQTFESIDKIAAYVARAKGA